LNPPGVAGGELAAGAEPAEAARARGARSVRACRQARCRREDLPLRAHVAKRQAEELARRAAVDFDSFYTDRVMDVTDEAELLLVLSFARRGS
jgi:hypothetical protein